MDGDEEKCIQCQKNVLDGEDWYECDSCTKILHKKCIDLTSSEARCTTLKKRMLKLICKECCKFLDNLPKVIMMIEDMKREVTEMKNQLKTLNAEVKQTRIDESHNASAKKNYAEALKTNTERVLVVKPNQEQESKLTKDEIKGKINPAEIGINIAKLKQVSKGAVVIGCENKEDRTILQTKLAKEMGDKYSVEIPTLKKPQLKIVNINKDDLEGEKDEAIIGKLTKQNKIDLNKKGFHMKILKQVKQHNSNSMALIIEADSATHNTLTKNDIVTIGWSRGRVYNHINIRKCYKCMGYNHIAKYCNSDIACPKCADNHSSSECQSQSVKCINCIKAIKNLNIDLDIKHSAYDNNCPCYRRILRNQSRKIEYSETEEA